MSVGDERVNGRYVTDFVDWNWLKTKITIKKGKVVVDDQWGRREIER